MNNCNLLGICDNTIREGFKRHNRDAAPLTLENIHVLTVLLVSHAVLFHALPFPFALAAYINLCRFASLCFFRLQRLQACHLAEVQSLGAPR